MIDLRPENAPQSILPEPAKPWFGLVLGVVLAFGLGLARPASLGRLTSGLMVICHGVTIAALTTLSIEAIRWGLRGRTLHLAELDGFGDESKWPRRLVYQALSGRLSGLFGQTDIDARLDKAATNASSDSNQRWWPYQLVAFLLPVLGFFDGWLNLRSDTGSPTLVEVFLPLPISILEAGLVLATSTGLSLIAQSQFERWQSVASRLLPVQSPLLRQILDEIPDTKGRKSGVRSDHRADTATNDGQSEILNVASPRTNHQEGEQEKCQRNEDRGSMFDDLFNSSPSSAAEPRANEIIDD